MRHISRFLPSFCFFDIPLSSIPQRKECFHFYTVNAPYNVASNVHDEFLYYTDSAVHTCDCECYEEAVRITTCSYRRKAQRDLKNLTQSLSNRYPESLADKSFDNTGCKAYKLSSTPYFLPI